MQKQHYMYCDYNDTWMIYVNSNIALLRVRNHYMINYKVLGNRARPAHHQSTYEILNFFNKNIYFLGPVAYKTHPHIQLSWKKS